MKLFYKTYNIKGVEYRLNNYKENPSKYHLSRRDYKSPLNGDKKFKEWFGMDLQMWEGVCYGTLKECEDKLNDIIYESIK